jgi:two-component system response regulator WspF
MMRRVLAGGGHQLAWIARNGQEAVRLCANDPPELVLMDLAMPVLDGVEATRRIMRASPCAILIVTAAPEDQVALVFRALGAGALDVVATPVLLGQAGGETALLAKIRMIGKLITGAGAAPAAALPAPAPGSSSAVQHLVAIGASTGGPAALARLLAAWRPGPDTAAVVVQHIDAAFAAHLAKWLHDQGHAPARVIADGDRLDGGSVLVAATEGHLRLGPDGRLRYSDLPREEVYRPSIDVFFHSVAQHWERPATGVLLTGMGRDGAAGLLALRHAGKATIAQDEATSAVYGMPRAAADLGAAQKILPLDNIGAVLSGRMAGPFPP